MSTIKDETFDYQAYTRENAPDPAKIQRGIEAREQRRKAATPKTVVVLMMTSSPSLNNSFLKSRNIGN